MPQISFVKNKAPIDVESGSNLMETLLAHGIPVASSCKGDGICGKCRMRIEPLQGQLPPASPAESETLRNNKANPGERLSCQMTVLQNLKIDTSYW